MSTVLFATDGSSDARRATNVAIERAWATRATLHVLCVVDRGILSEAALSSADLDTIAAEDEAFAAVAAAAASGERIGIDVVTSVVHGSPIDAICSYADEIDAEAIVLGTHSESERHPGGVGRRVARDTDRETLVVG